MDMNREKRAETIQKAEHFLAGNRVDEARTCFEHILRQAPDCFEAHHGLGIIAAQHCQWELAVGHFATASQLRPKLAQVWYNFGIALKATQQPIQAISCFETALSLAPDHANACNSLGTTLAALNRPQAALEYYEQTLRIDPHHLQAIFNLGRVHQDLGQWDAAVKCYERAIGQCPSFAPAWSNLGTILQNHGHEDDALQCFRQACASAPTFADAWINLGLLLFRQNQLEQAWDTALVLSQLPDHADFPHYSLGLLFAKLNKPAEAQRHLSMALQRDPADTQGAALILAGLELAPMPKRSSTAQMEKLYGTRAALWDAGAAARNSYRGHELVCRVFADFYPQANQSLHILDAGCGTGLVGQSLNAKHFARLDGIDLSAPMLERAIQKSLYTHLHLGDLVEYMTRHPQTYDVVLSAATLIHFGDLRPVLRSAAQTLRPAGRFIFTLFPGPDDAPDGITISLHHGHAEGGCYLHSGPHLRQWAAETGWQVELIQDAIHEFDRGAPVTALLVCLRRI